MIKVFISQIIRDNVLKTPEEFKEGIKEFNLDSLDFYCDFGVHQILREIEFYDKFEPYKFIKNAVSPSNSEFFVQIPVKIKITESKSYEDVITWNLLDKTFTPESFALQIQKDEKLTDEMAYQLSMKIRKEIKENMFKVMKSTCESHRIKPVKNKKKIISLNNELNNLSEFLGKKRSNISERKESEIPYFLVNSQSRISLLPSSPEPQKSKKTLDSLLSENKPKKGKSAGVSTKKDTSSSDKQSSLDETDVNKSKIQKVDSKNSLRNKGTLDNFLIVA